MIRSRRLAALVAGLILAGCAESTSRQPAPSAAQVQPADPARETVQTAGIGSIPNLTRLGDLYFAGQPSAGDLALLPDAGVTTVISLRHEAELGGFDEKSAVQDLGLQYLEVPWNGPAELTDDVFDRTRAMLLEVDSPTLFHCGSANRVGAVWLPYRVLDEGVPVEQAVEEARKIGMRTPEYEARALDYIARNLESR